MKNVNSKSNKINIVFSSFLVIGYIICTYFFSSLAGQISGTFGGIIQALMLIVFGLLLFYATRVGEGKQVRRFSLAVLLLMVVPSLYIILAYFIPNLLFSAAINPEMATLVTQVKEAGLDVGQYIAQSNFTPSLIFSMACVALGYGIPYTFLSGYEMKEEDEEDDEDYDYDEDEEYLEGGLAEELAEAEDMDDEDEDNEDVEDDENEEEDNEDSEVNEDDDDFIEILDDDEEEEETDDKDEE